MPVKSREQLARSLFGVSLETLERYPERALKFARGVGTNVTLRATLQQRGYTPAVHNLVWDRLQTVCNISLPAATDTFDAKALDAIPFIDSNDEMLFEIISASVAPRFPEQAAFLCEGIGPSTGMTSVINTRTLLDRMNQLEKSPERKETRKKDHAVLELLAERGVTPELRDRLAAAVKTATAAPVVAAIDTPAIAASDEAYVKALGELRAWYDEWSRVARVTIKRRDHLILLGLAQRKTTRRDEPAPSDPTDE